MKHRLWCFLKVQIVRSSFIYNHTCFNIIIYLVNLIIILIGTLLNDKSLNQDLSRNQYKIEKINKIKNGTFWTEAHPSIIHYPLCSDLPEPYNKLMRVWPLFLYLDGSNIWWKRWNECRN